MGVLYKARHLRLNRSAAIKMIIGGKYHSPNNCIRFLIEAEAVARRDHPHIVHLYEFGTHENLPFFAMEYVGGGTLAGELTRAGKMSPRAAAELVRKLADGIAAAHAKGIVHRDLKPANILLTEASEPKIADFGLAKVGQSDLTATGAVMGTPSYMAPEQAVGKSQQIGTPADVHALGAILFELLTGRPPFKGETAMDTIQMVLTQEPPRLRSIDPAIPKDIESVCLKCLEKEPANRYPTAVALAEDLRRFLGGEPVSVRPAGRAERLVKWARRNPTAAGLYAATTIGAVLLGFAVTIGVLWRDAVDAKGQAERTRDELAGEKDKTETARRDAENTLGLLTIEKEKVDRAFGLLEIEKTQTDNARQQAENTRDALKLSEQRLARLEYGRTMQLAYQEWRDNNLKLATDLLRSTRPEFRGWEFQYVHKLCNGHLFAWEPYTSGASVAFSPDGSRIVTGSGDNTAKVGDANTGAEVLTLKGHSAGVSSVGFSADGTRILTASLDGTAKVWDAQPMKPGSKAREVPPLPREK